ncbi:MAG: hypothetical protein HZB14_06500 [Actinobacteria bacterium]|nr:hypothetical protein [Actinomycetota bacterium]
MKRTLANRPIAAMVVVFSVVDALILRGNPFGNGTIPWIGAIAVAIAGNAVLAYVVAGWSAPYLVSSGGSAGAAAADPRSVSFAEIWMSFALMTVGVIALLAVDFASRDLIVSPTQRSERNAELVRDTVREHAPQEFQLLLTAADTWKMSENTYRSCIPSSKDQSKYWCVLVRGDEKSLKVTRYGPGTGNAEQFLIWHPEYRGKRKAD